MGFVGSSTLQVINSDTTTTVINLSMPTPNVEVSQALPANTKYFMLRSRSGATTRIAYNSGETATAYITLNGQSVYDNAQFYTSQTLYLRVDAADTIEIEAHV